MTAPNISVGLALRVFAPFALGYFLVSVFRSINAVIASDLARDFEVGPAGLGFAVSAFFLSATLFQLPYGILLDRYDARRLYASLLLFSALGAVLTAVADSILMFGLGRVLIALGIAASAVTSFKVYSVWFPSERLPLVNGLSLAAGGLGLMAGTAPVEITLQFIDWRTIHLILAALLVASAALVAIVAPAKQSETAGLTLLQEIEGLRDVAKSAVFWRAAPVTAMVIGIFGAFTQLWAGPWVRDVAGLSGPEAARLLLVLAAAMTISGLVTGGLTVLARRCGLAPMEFAVATAGLFALVLVVLFLQWTPSPLAVLVTWALFGFVAALNFVTYAALAPQFAPGLTGRMNACLTLAWMLGAFVLQNAYGLVLDLFPATNGGYSIEGHRAGMGIMLLFLLLAIGWFFLSPHLLKGRPGV
jgi:predicted MFS family arabinose efflux permease